MALITQLCLRQKVVKTITLAILELYILIKMLPVSRATGTPCTKGTIDT